MGPNGPKAPRSNHQMLFSAQRDSKPFHDLSHPRHGARTIDSWSHKKAMLPFSFTNSPRNLNLGPLIRPGSPPADALDGGTLIHVGPWSLAQVYATITKISSIHRSNLIYIRSSTPWNYPPTADPSWTSGTPRDGSPCHPFSAPSDSVGELLHTPYRFSTAISTSPLSPTNGRLFDPQPLDPSASLTVHPVSPCLLTRTGPQTFPFQCDLE